MVLDIVELLKTFNYDADIENSNLDFGTQQQFQSRRLQAGSVPSGRTTAPPSLGFCFRHSLRRLLVDNWKPYGSGSTRY